MKNIYFVIFGLIFSLNTFGQDKKIIRMSNNDIIYVPAQDKLYVTTPSGGSNGNSLCIIDPYFGTIEECIFIGSEPNKLAASDDGQFLYIGLSGAPEVVKFNLNTKRIDLKFTLGADSFLGQYYAEDLEVVPGSPNSVVVARRNSCCSPKHEGVAIYDDGVQRPNSTQDHTGSNTIAFAGDNQLFGYNNETTEYGFREILIEAEGLRQGAVSSRLISGFGVKIEGHDSLVYSTNGTVVNVATSPPTVAGRYSLTSGGAAVEPAPDSNIVYFITSSFSDNHKLEVYDKNTFNRIETMTLEEIEGSVVNLLSWGTDGKLAFNTGEMVVILRNCISLVSEPLPLEPFRVGGCRGQSVTITAPDGYENYFWSTGQTTQSISTDQEGAYSYAVADSLGCLSTPSNPAIVELDNIPSAPQISGSSIVDICQGESITLSPSSTFGSNTFLWSTGETTTNIQVSEAGTYTLTRVTPNGCVGRESNPVRVILAPDSVPSQPTVEVVGDTVLCRGDMTILVAPDGFSSYLWSNGQTTQEIIVSNSGNYSVVVGNESGCMSESSERQRIEVNSIPFKPFIQVNGNLLASSALNGNQWFLNGNPIPDATERFYTATQSGFYSVVVTINGCSSEMSDLYSHFLVNRTNLKNESGISIYPNPAEDIIQLKIDNLKEPIAEIEFYDMLGKKVKKITQLNSSNDYQVSIHDLSKGTYYVKILGNKGALLLVEKLVKL